MASQRSADLIAYARDLEERDTDIASQIDRTAGLLHRVDDVRARAGLVREALAALPDEMSRAEHAVAAARAREEDARLDVVDAERRVEEISRTRRTGAEATAEAARALRRAVVALADAAAAVAHQEARRQALASDEDALRAEADALAAEALVVSRDARELPRLSESGRTTPGASLAEIEEWGARTHSAIFVVRGGLDAERERLVHEANILAAASLGEQGGAASVSLVRRRLEEELGGA